MVSKNINNIDINIAILHKKYDLYIFSVSLYNLSKNK